MCLLRVCSHLSPSLLHPRPSLQCKSPFPIFSCSSFSFSHYNNTKWVIFVYSRWLIDLLPLHIAMHFFAFLTSVVLNLHSTLNPTCIYIYSSASLYLVLDSGISYTCQPRVLIVTIPTGRPTHTITHKVRGGPLCSFLRTKLKERFSSIFIVPLLSCWNYR